MGNTLSAIISYRLYDNWKMKRVFLYKNTPEDNAYEEVLKECFLSNDSLQIKTNN